MADNRLQRLYAKERMSTNQSFTVGIAGRARSGKDSLGGHLIRRLNEVGNLGKWERRGVADPVKRIFMDVFGVDEIFVENWKTRGEPPAGFQLPVRECLTLIGDGFRHMRPTVWIDFLYQSSRGSQVVTDVRYINEIQCIRARSGAVIVMHRPGIDDCPPTPSEQELMPLVRQLIELRTEGPVQHADVCCDYFLINDGSLEDI
jgi:hypothetical protein